MQLERSELQVDNESLVCEFLIKKTNAVILHGAGQHTEHKRYYRLAAELLKINIGVVLFDFSGHGESTGSITELSLARRRTQAQQVIDKLTPPESKLYLLGFSMSAQTVCDLLPIYKSRVLGVLLASPAIYTIEAFDLPFGDSEFTSKLRKEKSWELSNTPNSLKEFDGNTILAIGSQDEVIPKEAIALLKKSANNPVFIEYPGAGHQLAAWLDDNPQELSGLIKSLVIRSH